MTTQFLWDDASIAALKVDWDDGLSASECAVDLMKKFRGVLSRSSVIGKVHRLKLAKRRYPGQPKVNKGTGARPRRRPNNPTPASRPRLVDRGNNFFALEAYDKRTPDYERDAAIRELPPEAIPKAQRKSFDELKYQHCRFIYGDPKEKDHFYCGGDRFIGRYCAYHHSITHIGTARISDFERARRRQAYINLRRIEAEKERLAV